MFESKTAQLSADLATLAEVGARIAAAIDSDLTGARAVDAFAELADIGKSIELAQCLAAERIDRSGAFADDGSRSAAAHLRRAAGESDAWAALRLRVGRALVDRMPATRKAWEAGQLGMTQADIIAAATKDLDDELAAATEQTLALAAPDITVKDLQGLAEMIRQQAAPEQAARKNRSDHDKQALTFVRTLHGSWDLKGRFDAETGAVIRQALDAFTRNARTGRQEDGQPAERPPVAFRRALAFAEICRQAAGHAKTCDPAAGGGRPTIIATVGLKDLRDGYGAGHAEDGIILPIPALRRLACDADVIRRIEAGNGQTLDFGRQQWIVPQALRRYLVSRDGGCVFAGCEVPASGCEAHHKIAWVDGGPTDPENTCLLCAFHHHLAHEGGWTLTGNPDLEGGLTFHPPPGSKHRPMPAERKTIHGAIHKLLAAIKDRDEEPRDER